MLPVAIGQIVATENTPNTAYSFTFWAKAEARLGIGSLIKVVTREADADVVVHGIVTEAHAYNDVASPLVDFFGSRGVPGIEAPTRRSEIRVFEAAVMRREPEEHPATAVGIGAVYKADENDLRIALGGVSVEKGIPIGCYRDGDDYLAVLADADFVIGPEAGHINITGTSGLAAKTSYIEFLLQSVFQTFRGVGEEGVAVVLFNVKGGDLLYLDQRADVSMEDARIYKVCGVEPKPFEKVTYYAPYADATRTSIKSHRSHPDFDTNPTRGFCFGLVEALQNAHVLLNRDDLDVKADAVLSYLRDDVANQDDYRTDLNSPALEVRTIDQLLLAMDAMLKVASASDSQHFKDMHVATIAKMKSRISGLSRSLPGLITKDGFAKNPLPKLGEAFGDRSVHVIDVADVNSQGQDLIFAATIADLRKRMEDGSLGVKHLIVVVDELNKYAPSGGHETYVLSTLRDIAARGRYLGLVLFGAQQFRSRVDPQIIGNCANSVYGHVQMEELAQPGYSVYSQAVREKLATADPGEVMFRHPRFSQPIFLRFPKPSIMKGSDGMKRWQRDREDDATPIINLAKTMSPGDVRRILEEVDHGRRKEVLAEVLEELMKDSSTPEETMRRVIGKNKRVVSISGLSRPTNDI
ncbi:MAG: ATP-binding protein [Armatimonadota bacterium]|nr:ATP-binding protein [Armatimonadota bacterium]